MRRRFLITLPGGSPAASNKIFSQLHYSKFVTLVERTQLDERHEFTVTVNNRTLAELKQSLTASLVEQGFGHWTKKLKFKELKVPDYSCNLVVCYEDHTWETKPVRVPFRIPESGAVAYAQPLLVVSKKITYIFIGHADGSDTE